MNIARIEGGAGDDRITGNRITTSLWAVRAMTLSGGGGDDLFMVVGDSGSDTVSGGAGFDRSADQTATHFPFAS